MTKAKLKRTYNKVLKDKNLKEKLEWIDNAIFSVEMIDRWQEEDKLAYDVLTNLRKEIMNDVERSKEKSE